jgi:hypothetical protein
VHLVAQPIGFTAFEHPRVVEAVEDPELHDAPPPCAPRLGASTKASRCRRRDGIGSRPSGTCATIVVVPARRPDLIVRFHKVDAPRPHAWWQATRRTRGTITGGHMPIGRGVIPHDLVHLATEGALGLGDGFWGLLARGATFKRGTDRKRTSFGRALVAANRGELQRAEHLGNEHHARWLAGSATPVAPAFDRLASLWSPLVDGGTLVVEWPFSLETCRTEDAPRARREPCRRPTAMSPSPNSSTATPN